MTGFVPLLDRLPDLTNMVISADMMHTQREHARYLHRRGASFVLPVGGNQLALFDQLDALAWAEVPIGWMTYDRHGRHAQPHHRRATPARLHQHRRRKPLGTRRLRTPA